MALIAVEEIAERLRTLPAGARALEAVGGAGEEIYLVGGAVRDLWLGGAPLDLDLVVVGEVGPLAARLGGEVRTHGRFGTATVHGPDGVRYDLARARRERYPHPGALPVVAPAGIGEDLQRRDFSVNALALGLSGPGVGTLLSGAHGLQDLAGRRLRVLHDRSFRDDPTRLLRLARYAARLGFAIAAGTVALARDAIALGALDTVSGPRIAAELVLLCEEPDPLPGFAVLRTLGIDVALAPGFAITDPELARRALTSLPADGDPTALLLGIAGRGIAREALRALLARLGVTASRREAALAVQDADRLATALDAARRPSEAAGVLAGSPVEAVAAAGALGGASAQASARAWLAGERRTELSIAGADLIAAGIEPGPAVGRGLHAARAAKLDGLAPTREAELAEALRAAREAG